jgi:hypothetical protein
MGDTYDSIVRKQPKFVKKNCPLLNFALPLRFKKTLKTMLRRPAVAYSSTYTKNS